MMRAILINILVLDIALIKRRLSRSMKTLILRNYFMPKYNNNVEIMHLIKLKVKKCKGGKINLEIFLAHSIVFMTYNENVVLLSILSYFIGFSKM